MREGLDGADSVLLDPHPLSPDHTVDVSMEDISQDGRVLVYGLRRGGEDETELHVRDVATRADLSGRAAARPLPRRVAACRTAAASTTRPRTGRPASASATTRMGTPPAQDVEVFGSGYGPSQWIGAEVSENGRHLLLTVQHGWARNDVFVQDLPRHGRPCARS